MERRIHTKSFKRDSYGGGGIRVEVLEWDRE